MPFASPGTRRRTRREVVLLACIGTTVQAVGQDELFGPLPTITTTSRSGVVAIVGSDSYVEHMCPLFLPHVWVTWSPFPRMLAINACQQARLDFGFLLCMVSSRSCAFSHVRGCGGSTRRKKLEVSDLPLSPSQKVAAMMPRTMRAADSKRKKFFGPGFDLDAIEEGEKPSSPLVRRCVCVCVCVCVCSPAHGMHAR